MKNKQTNAKRRSLLAIALATVIGFAFITCDDGSGGKTGTAPTITTTTLANGTVGTAYSQTLTATGDAPITWSIDTGSLPDGLSLTTGVIAGTPTTAGTSNFTVKATNATGNDTKALSIFVAPVGGGNIIINIAAIAGVTAPVQGATPVTAITANDQYTGTVAWNGTPAEFEYDTVYTATITLTAKTGYTLQGVTEDFFTVAGADSVSNAANSGVVTAIFPQTADDPALLHLAGDLTISPNTDAKTHMQLTATYSGSEAVSFQWQKNGNNIGTASTTNPNTYTPTEEGSYTVIVSLEGYNSKSAAVTVTTADLSGDVTISPNTDAKTHMQLTATYSGSEAVSFQWEKNGGNIGTASTTNPNTYTPTEAGSYTVTVSAAGYNPKTSDPVTVIALTGITAVYNGQTTVDYTTPLDSFKTDLTVTAQYSNNTSKTVTDYTLSGTLTANTSAITVSYEGKTTTFTVTSFALFTAIADMTTFLSSQHTNTADNPYDIRLNVAALPWNSSGQAQTAISDKYVKLDLSGSTFTSIGNSAFSSCTSLTGIIIPENVTSIGNSAFYRCTSLTGITIPEGVMSIGSQAFQYCSSLTGSITIPTGVTIINNSAFSNCHRLTSVTILAGVTSIGTYAFDGCTSLTGITIPTSVTSIGACAFFGCAGLTSINIPSSVTSIGERAFIFWTSSQTIYVSWTSGNKPAGWNDNWNQDCYAQIVYQQ